MPDTGLDYGCKRVNVSFDAGTLRLIDYCAEMMGVTRSRMLSVAIRYWLDSHRMSLGRLPWEGDE